jgi:hypothetical protein
MAISLTRQNFNRLYNALVTSAPFFSKRNAAALAEGAAGAPQELTLWYREPANRWASGR